MIDLSILNHAENDAICELRNRVEEIMPDELRDDSIFYYKFLKARDFNLDKAEKMLRKHIEWRKHHQLSTILKNFQPKELFFYLLGKNSFGNDKDGDILFYFPSGKLDITDVSKCVTLNDYMKHVIWYGEKWAAIIKNQREKDGLKSQQITMISDLDELTLSNVSSKAFAEVCIRVACILQDNFPETLKSMIVINAPSYYVIAYNLVKIFLSKAFLQKVKIYGKTEWQAHLLDIIDEDVLPAFLGGKRTDPDGNPLCNTIITHWGRMPKRFYLSEEDRSFKDKSRVKKVFVSYLSKENVYFDVMEKNSVIEWEFLVIKKDVGFGLFFQGSDGVIDILPIQKYDTLDGVERGFYKTQFTGKYFITFDNSSSWLNNKEIQYCITVRQKEI